MLFHHDCVTVGETTSSLRRINRLRLTVVCRQPGHFVTVFRCTVASAVPTQIATTLRVTSNEYTIVVSPFEVLKIGTQELLPLVLKNLTADRSRFTSCNRNVLLEMKNHYLQRMIVSPRESGDDPRVSPVAVARLTTIILSVLV